MNTNKSQELSEIYNSQFKENYKEYSQELKSLLYESNGKKLSVKLGQFNSVLFEKIQLFSMKRISSNGLQPDLYTEALFKEYKYRMSEYEEPVIDFFISEHLERIKSEFIGKELALPENIALNESQTVELIARWQAGTYLLEKLHQIKDSDNADKVIDRISFDYFDANDDSEDHTEEIGSNNGKVNGLTMKQQTIILSYMLDALGSKFVDKTVKARFVQKLTRRSYDNIYDVVREPLKYKEYALFKKDMDLVRNEFSKLNLDELASKVLKDLESN